MTKNMTKSKLRITEIFFSLQGETRTAGIPTIFIRLTGCPLRCQYCDSAYAFQGGQYHSIDEIIANIKQYQTRYVTVTGGEPLAQVAVHELMRELCDLDYEVSLETSGALPVGQVDPRVIKVLDLKTPGSLEQSKNDWSNIEHLDAKDQVKFVICDRNDYDWCVKILEEYRLNHICQVLFSASFEQLSLKNLADWIIQDQLPVRMQLQMHKYIWGDIPGK